MSSQIFKSLVPKEMFFSFLNEICLKNEKHYILDNISFKKGIYNGTIQAFFEQIKEFYYNSKKNILSVN